MLIFLSLFQKRRTPSMTGKEIRKSFLDYFAQRGHTIVASSPVIPNDDPTLLFSNAGMNQFKTIFTGERPAPYKRACSVQKCIRVSGKHNDFEDVGYDGTHHTFFEMLGNWSFGDYYKAEAIRFAWELLTDIYKIDKTKLYATVYLDDDEALQEWKKNTDIDPSHISRHDKKDNFWEMGDTGPCGPCSEIHIDRGPGFCQHENTPNHKCGVNADGCGRFVELWNLVFIQYNRDESGKLNPLKFKSVDTGMGLERIVSVMSQTKTNYKTDLFTPILDQIAKDTGKKIEENHVAFQVIADHIRGLSVAITDGGMPGNEGRGYVIRKILRRAIRFSRKLGNNKPYLFTLVDKVVEIFGDTYPEIRQNSERVKTIIKTEEVKFLETLDNGLSLLSQSIDTLKKEKKTILPGDVIFKLYDTYGFPTDITKEIGRENNLTLDLEGYQKLMGEQKQRGRDSWKKSTSSATFADIDFSELEPTIFTGYEMLEGTEKPIGLFVMDSSNGSWKKTDVAQESDQVMLLFSKTPFYAESGGQEGDEGTITSSSGKIQVSDTQKYNDLTLHLGNVTAGKVTVKDDCRLEVNNSERLATRLNHTATHLLQAALRNVVGTHVGQAGSAVGPDKLRFDFTNPKGLTEAELEKVETLVNEFIRTATPVKTDVMGKDEAIKTGAMAFFGEKYSDKVRVVSVEGISKELCGGTHIDNIGRIGLFLILSEASAASGIRRIEAVTGSVAYALVKNQRNQLKEIANLLKTKDGIAEKIQSLIEQNKKLEKDLKSAKERKTGNDDSFKPVTMEKAGIKIQYALIEDTDMDSQRIISDRMKNDIKTGIVILSNKKKETGALTVIVAVTQDQTAKYKAGEVLKNLLSKIGGKGGGRPDFAQGGAKDPGNMAEVIEEFVKGI